MRLVFLLAILLPVAVAPARAGDLRVTLAGTDAAGEPLVKVECVDTPLADVLRALSRATRRTAVASPSAGAVTLTLGPTPWRDAVAALAALDAARVEPLGPRGLRAVPAPRVSIEFDAANVRTILQLASAYSGFNVVVGEAVRGELTATLREVDALHALHALARACDARLDRQGEVLLVGPSLPSRLPVPGPAGRPPPRAGPEVRAALAPAGALLCVLARSADLALVIGAGVLEDDERLSLEWPPSGGELEAIEQVAALRGWRLEQVGAVWVILAGGGRARVEGGARADPDARRRVEVPLAGREPLGLALQAVVLGAPPLAIVNGRAYAPGDTLVDPATDEEVEGLRLDEVGPRHAVVLDERGARRVRLSLDSDTTGRRE